MNSWASKAFDIFADRGMNITQEDVQEIELLLFKISFADDEGQKEAAMIMEGVWQIINDPRYKGDAQAMD